MQTQGWVGLIAWGLVIGMSSSAHAGNPPKAGVIVTDGKNKVVLRAEGDGDGDEVEVDGNTVKAVGAADAQPTGKELVINGNAKKETHVCKAEGLQVVIINGNSNDVTLTGDCSSVTISGNAQKVTIDGAAKIVVSGNTNKVTYLRGLKGEAPKVVNSGNANKVSVRKP